VLPLSHDSLPGGVLARVGSHSPHPPSTPPQVALACVGDGFNALLGGVLRACGRQAWGAGLNLFSYW